MTAGVREAAPPVVARFVRWRRWRRPVSLAHAVLSDQPWRYPRWRLRFMLLRAVVLAVVFLSEVTFFYDVFAVRYFVNVLALYYVYSFGSALWWGALESARRRVRHAVRAGDPARAVAVLRPWLWLSLAIAAIIIAVAALVIAARMRRVGVFSVFDLSTAALLGRLALDVVVRTYQAGVQAIRRIYRPMWLVVALDAADVLAVVALWPLLGPYAFGAVYAVTALASSAVTAVYSRAAWRRSPLAGLPLLGRRPLLTGLRGDLSSALVSGLANAAARADGVMLLWLLWNRESPQAGMAVAAWLHMIAPAFKLCVAWPRPFALDVERLAHRWPPLLRRRFERQLVWVAFAMAVFATALAGLITLSLAPPSLSVGVALVAALPVAAIWSLAARTQVIAFMTGRSVVALIAALLPAAGIASALHAVAERSAWLFAVVFALTAGSLWWLARRSARPTPWIDRPRGLSPLLRLLHEVAESLEPTRIALLRCDPRVDIPTHRVATALARSVPELEVALVDRRTILVAASCAECPASMRSRMAEISAGLVRSVDEVTASSGWEALRSLVLGGALGGGWCAAFGSDATAVGPEVLRDRFRHDFPEGYVVSPRGRGIPLGEEGVEAWPLLRGLLGYLRGRRRRGGADLFEVSAFAPSGEPQLIFAVPRSVEPSRRLAWRETLDVAHRGAVVARVAQRR